MDQEFNLSEISAQSQKHDIAEDYSSEKDQLRNTNSSNASQDQALKAAQITVIKHDPGPNPEPLPPDAVIPDPPVQRYVRPAVCTLTQNKLLWKSR